VYYVYTGSDVVVCAGVKRRLGEYNVQWAGCSWSRFTSLYFILSVDSEDSFVYTALHNAAAGNCLLMLWQMYTVSQKTLTFLFF